MKHKDNNLWKKGGSNVGFQSQEFLKHLLEEQKEERRRLLEALQKQKVISSNLPTGSPPYDGLCAI